MKRVLRSPYVAYDPENALLLMVDCDGHVVATRALEGWSHDMLRREFEFLVG